MRRWHDKVAAIVVFATVLLFCIEKGETFTHGFPVGLTCNIVTGVSNIAGGTCNSTLATCNGVADDSAAFASFNTWAVANQGSNQVQLTIPTGSVCILNGIQAGRTFAKGIKNFIVIGYGATLTTSVGYFLGTDTAFFSDSFHSARINTVSAGATTVTVPSYSTTNVSNAADNGSGAVRLTVASTSGFSTGQFVPVLNIIASTRNAADLGNVVNANGQRIVVVDATHIDLPTVAFASGATYTSGGTVGGTVVGIFSVGQYVLIGGYSLQSDWRIPGSFPANLHYFEYVKITAINAGTGQISFDRSLKNGYKSAWPNYNAGSTGQGDAGGPATIYAIDPSWDAQVEYRGLTINNTASQTSIIARNAVIRDSSITGINCVIPSQNMTWVIYNSRMASCSIEADKLVTEVDLVGVNLGAINFQSSSIDVMNVTSSTITNIAGTPKKTTMASSTVTGFLHWGATAFGRSDEFVCTVSCNLAADGIAAVLEKGPADGGVNVGGAYTMSGGVITVPNTLGAVRWAVPGTNLMWAGQFTSETSFQVVDVTQDATNTYVATSLAGGFPTVPLTTGKLFIQVHPSPKFTCSGCFGNPDAVDIAQTPAGAPLYSYSKRTYTQASVYGAGSDHFIWGTVQSIELNVTAAYGGAGANAFNWIEQTVLSNGTGVLYNSNTNLKTVGDRLVTPSGSTCASGTCTGDSGLALSDPVTWLAQAAEAAVTAIDSPFSITVTVQANQGVVNP